MSQSKLSSASTELATKCLQWIHPPASLIQGKVIYGVRMLGYTEVAATTGATLIRDAYHAIKAANEKAGLSQKLIKVELGINISDVQISDAKTKILLHSHQLRKISYCAEDKMDRRIFAYIATDDSEKYICYVFFTSDDTISAKIISTIGEAFDLAVHEYYNKTMPKNDDIIKLRDENKQLRSENEGLKLELDFYKRKCGVVEMDAVIGSSLLPPLQQPPPLPKTPIPKPPPGFELRKDLNQVIHSSGTDDFWVPLDRAPSLKLPAMKFAPVSGDDSLLPGQNESLKAEVTAAKEKKNPGLKLLMPPAPLRNDGTVSGEIKSDSKNTVDPKSASPKAEKSVGIHVPTTTAAEYNDDDDDYMVPRNKLPYPQ